METSPQTQTQATKAGLLQYHTTSQIDERISKDERDRRIARTDARPASSSHLGLRGPRGFSVRRHPRDIPDHGAASHDPIVHLALTTMAGRILHVRSHMQRGAELRGLEEESPLECRVECHARRRVSRGSVKDQVGVRWARGEGYVQDCVSCVCVDAEMSARARGRVGGERDVGLEETADADADALVGGKTDMKCETIY